MMGNSKIKWWLFTAAIFINAVMFSGVPYQTSPFDIIPRLDSTKIMQREDALTSTQKKLSVFDIIPKTNQRTQNKLDKKSKQNISSESTTRSLNGTFGILISGILFFLISIIFLFQNTSLFKLFESFLNSNITNHIQRDQRKIGYYVWGLVGILNLGTFTYLCLLKLYPAWVEISLMKVVQVIAIIFSLIFLKTIVLYVLRYAFKLKKHIDHFQVLVINWIAIIGLLIFPINVLLLFAPTNLTFILIVIGSVLVVVGYIFRTLRGILFTSNLLLAHPIHYFIYLLIIEVSPFLIGYQVLTKQ